MLESNSQLIEHIREIATAAYPNEACGVVVSVEGVPIAVECRNIHEKPRDFFAIDPLDYSRAGDRGEIVAIWHSHPSGLCEATDVDRVSCETWELPWLIVPLRRDQNGEMVFGNPVYIEPCGFEMPYLQRPYVYGVFDCYTLIRDFYKREFGVALPNKFVEYGWWKRGENHFVEDFPSAGFVQLIDQEPKRGDLFLMQCEPGNPGHFAVYLGDDTIMHHCEKRLSRRDVYGGSYWQRHTTHHLRHESQC